MSYGLKLKTPGVLQPISLAEAKAHMRIDPALEDTEMDVMIDALIKAAREYCESYQNRSYITQTWQLVLDCWPSVDYIDLARPPLVSAGITYIDSAGFSHTMPIADYIVDTTSYTGRIVLGYGEVWPTETLRPGAAITIEYIAGYGATGSTIPFTARAAMLLLVSHWYENREALGTAGNEIKFAVSALLDMNKVY